MLPPFPSVVATPEPASRAAVVKMNGDQRSVDHVPENPKLLTISNTQEKFEVALRGDGAVPPVAAAFMAAISAGEQAVMVGQDVAAPSTVQFAAVHGSGDPVPPPVLSGKPSNPGSVPETKSNRRQRKRKNTSLKAVTSCATSSSRSAANKTRSRCRVSNTISTDSDPDDDFVHPTIPGPSRNSQRLQKQSSNSSSSRNVVVNKLSMPSLSPVNEEQEQSGGDDEPEDDSLDGEEQLFLFLAKELCVLKLTRDATLVMLFSPLQFFSHLRLNSTYPMAILTADFVPLDDALALANGSVVDFVAVVASVGALDHDTLFPQGIREIALKDNTRIAFLRIFTEDNDGHRDLLIDSGVENYFLIGTHVVVDSNARCLTATSRSSLTFVGSKGCPMLSSLEEIRHEVRHDPLTHDQIKIALICRADELKSLQSPQQVPTPNNQCPWCRGINFVRDGRDVA
ncbi:hypothetical protein ACP70R_018322 [Stipagrostis hirtigluma subsp. patula]